MNNEPLVNLSDNIPASPPSEPKIYTMPGISNPTPTPPPPISPNPPTPPTSGIGPVPTPIANPDQPFNLKKLGSLFSQTIKTIWQKKWRFVYLNIVPKLLIFLPLILVFVAYAVLSLLIKNSGVQSIINIVMGIFGLISIVYLILYALWSQAATIFYLRTDEVSKKIILKQSKKQTPGLLWTTIVAGFMAFGWFILFMIVVALWSIFVDHSKISIIVLSVLGLVITIYSIIRSIRFSLAGIVRLVEGLGAMASVKRSKALIIGYSWPVFKRQIMLGYLQFIIQIAFTVFVALIFWFGSVNKAFLILAILFGLAVFLFMLLVSYLLEPFNFAYYYDIYQNLSVIKNKDTGAQERHGLGYKLGVLGLVILLPLLWLGMFFINLIFNSGTSDLSLLNKITPLLSGTGLNLNSGTNLNLENLDNSLAVDQNFSFDFLKTLGDDDVKELNSYSNQLFKELPSNPNQADLPVFNAEEFRQLLTTAGFDTDKIMTEFSLEKQKFIWNSFYLGMASSAADNQATVEPVDNAPTNIFSGLDSDSDGLTDEEEQIFGTYPSNPDSDGDGYLDGEEVLNGYNPLGPGKLIQ